MSIIASRFHDFSTGHRVYGHESKCSMLHGHNYRVHFDIEAPSLDKVGRVMDFSVIKDLLCEWLEQNWDHKFLIFKDDPFSKVLKELDPAGVVVVDYNPTAEQMAEHLVKVVAPKQLFGTGCTLIKCTIEETRKCSVSYNLDKKEPKYHD